jgi:hypothetical protein
MRKTCYGNLFPNLLALTTNRMEEGQAFSALVESFGIGVHDRKVAVNMGEWEKCAACPDYRTCYDLSLGKLILQQAVLRYS